MEIEKDNSLREIAIKLKAGGMPCNCDLDNWEPTQITGHSWVCRIHKAAIEQKGCQRDVNKQEG